MKDRNPYPYAGLTEKEVNASFKRFGSNKIDSNSDGSLWHVFKEIIADPMLLLLAVAAIIYFVSGEISDALFMSGAILFIVAISVYQSNRSRNALQALKEFTQPNATAIRNNRLISLQTGDIVVGDYIVASEGELIPADGIVKQLNDFSVNESILTGESFSVTKDTASKENNRVYRGTLVESGQCIFEVSAIGNKTELGKLGKSIQYIRKEKSPLQKQVNAFVKWMSLVGAVIFFIIWGVNFSQSGNILDSLLKSLTIAMSVLPEEIPVAFISFMAIGAWRLLKMGIIVKEPSVVEALGAATVICLDKTGTITENKMEIHRIYDFTKDTVVTNKGWGNPSVRHLISVAMWASETVPFDHMEKAIHLAYEKSTAIDMRPQFKMIYEYPLDGKPPMMTHIFENDNGEKIIAMKGAPEAILKISLLDEAEKRTINDKLLVFGKEGLRVLGIGLAEFEGEEYPEKQQEFKVRFLGLIGFYDPPKKNIKEIFQQIYAAGIQLKIITGDNPVTSAAIARQTHFRGYENAITSAELLQLEGSDFDRAVIKNSLFTRMFPEVKLKIIQSLKQQNHVVGMTGDGVNDGPALKAATIGIAMGKRGSEMAREASAIILTDDDFGKMIDGIAMGRKIYTNLKKAIQYIISIHIPIILMVSLPLFLGWIYQQIFTPVHVIFLELIMGPTCSIVYENEPMEENTMKQPPRVMTDTFFNWRELIISIIQGLVITLGILFVYQLTVHNGRNEEKTRAMVFSTLIFANIFLSYANRSFYYGILESLKKRNFLLTGITILILFLLFAILYIKPFSGFFRVTALNFNELILAFAMASVSVFWFEVYKWIKRKRIQESYQVK